MAACWTLYALKKFLELLRFMTNSFDIYDTFFISLIHLNHDKLIMYGWKARLGIMPTMDDMVLEPELYSMAPDGVAIYTSRLHKPNSDTTVETQSSAIDSVERCVDELVLARPKVICFGSTS